MSNLKQSSPPTPMTTGQQSFHNENIDKTQSTTLAPSPLSLSTDSIFNILHVAEGREKRHFTPKFSHDICEHLNIISHADNHIINDHREKAINRHLVKEPCVVEEYDHQHKDISVIHDLIAGGIAGCTSVIVGHPLDTIKVRLQTSSVGSTSGAFDSLSSLYRGLAAPLSMAAVLNAIVFSSFGYSSRLWDDYFADAKGKRLGVDADEEELTFDWKKNFVCGSFAGFVQCLVICPTEHIKCRLQIVQDSKSVPKSAPIAYRGPSHVMQHIISSHGIKGLYRGWYATSWREIPAFGVYFAIYDYVKEKINNTLRSYDPTHSHSWAACAFAGGISGSFTWGMIYPMDIIKTKIQTSCLDSVSKYDRKIWYVGEKIIKDHGWRFMFRGLGVTLLRAFPVNGIIFPVYEFTLMNLVD